MSKFDLMLLYALTSTHVGSGDDLNYIDLPIQREKHTNFPKIEASSLKGSIRSDLNLKFSDKNEDKKYIDQLLGSIDNGNVASAVSFTDARLLFFPVKSAKGIFAYVTCPMVVSRFISDYNIAFKDGSFSTIDTQEFIKNEELCLVHSECKLILGNQVVLEEYVLKIDASNNVFKQFIEAIKEQVSDEDLLTSFVTKVALVSDDMFKHFVTRCTEVVTRTKINEQQPSDNNKKSNNLFTQENLPPESILYSLISYSKPSKLKDDGQNLNDIDSEKKVMDVFKEKFPDREIFQIGGDATLGKGLMRKYFWRANDEKPKQY